MKNGFLLKLNKALCLLLVLLVLCFGFGCKDNNDTPSGDNPPSPELPNEPQTTYDYVYFGSYPISLVKEQTEITSLNSILGGLPNSANLNGWTDYEYYILGKKESYSFYKDLTLGEQKYRAVYFTKYRPYSSKLDSTTLNSFQDDNGYLVNNIYYFKYEPIKWRVLDEDNGKKILLSNVILDSQPFQPDYYENTIIANKLLPNHYYINTSLAPVGTMACSYKYSYIRNYLNDAFYNVAFTSDEKNFIMLTENANDSNSAGENSDNIFPSDTTEDYVYLASHKEIESAKYGFKPIGEQDDLRKLEYTDYAKCQGAYYDFQGDYKWWLRSFSFYVNKYSRTAQCVTNTGKVYNYHYVDYTIMGVVPMMIISE
jgi:hypothetical protein